jgi:hypothetical protein
MASVEDVYSDLIPPGPITSRIEKQQEYSELKKKKEEKKRIEQ